VKSVVNAALLAFQLLKSHSNPKPANTRDSANDGLHDSPTPTAHHQSGKDRVSSHGAKPLPDVECWCGIPQSDAMTTTTSKRTASIKIVTTKNTLSCTVALIALVSSMLATLPARAEAPATPTKMATVDAQVVLNAYQGLVEEHLAGVLHSIRAVAVSSEAKSANWERTKPILDRLSKDLETDAAVWYAMPDGTYFSTDAEGLTEKNLSDRSYFPRLMSGKDLEGDLVLSKSTGHRSVIVATPVMADGKVVAAIGVSLRLRLISQFVEKNTQLPADMYFYSMNSDALISTHRNIDRMFKHPTDIGDESLGPAFTNSLKSEKGNLAYELHGKNISAIFQKSKTLDWHFFIAKQVD
jgi:methyl-accepting chemotaxis protein